MTKINPDIITHRFFSSKEWRTWEKEVTDRMNRQCKRRLKSCTCLSMEYGFCPSCKKFRYNGVWDIDESRELGLISEGHWNDFIKWLKKQK